MRIFVIGDTHGKTDQAVEIYRSLKDIDLIVHLGDLYADAKKLESQLGMPVLKVKGNMDGSFSADVYQILETGFGKVYIAHGHMENVKDSPQNLLYKAESLGCKAAFYGHTHVPVFAEVQGMFLLNPGSLTRPVGGRAGSYAVATLEEGSMSASILYVDPAILSKGGDKQKNSKGVNTEPGMLRNLLNNSDRF